MEDDEPTQETKDTVDAFIAEGGYNVGGPGPHMSEAEIQAVLDDLTTRIESTLHAGTELEHALATVDAYQYFMQRLLTGREE
jgi:hypothetical protein